MQSDVFISYSIKDSDAAEAVRARIEAEKVRCWISSRDIPFGADWDKAVAAGLKSCRVMVLIFSSRSNNSEQIWGEVKLAYEAGLTIMPFRVEDEKPGEELKPWLSSVQWVDALTPPMERHIEKLALQVKAFIDEANAKGMVKPVARPPIPVPAKPPPLPSQRYMEEDAGKKGKAGLIVALVLLIVILAGSASWFAAMKKPSVAQQQAASPSAPYTPPPETAQQAAAARVVVPTPPPVFPPTKHMLEATREKPLVNSLGMKFVPVPGTQVLFCIWDTRVKDYSAYAAANPGVDKSWLTPGFKQEEDCPVVNVSWNDAKAFCAWLTKKDRAAGKIGKDEQYRLPTDAEWSIAAGPGKYPWGDQWPPPEGAGNYDPSLKVDDYENTSPVGSFPPNQFGLYDMGGNVWQWCEDFYRPEMNTKEILEKYTFLDDDGIYHVVRGASWSSGFVAESLLSSYRYNGYPVNRDNRYGFRCVLASTPPSP